MPQPPNVDPCSEFVEASNAALARFDLAIDKRDAAQDTLDDEQSIFDESNWASAGAIVGMGLACATNPIGWAVCGGGMLVGGAAFVGSEMDREGDIEDAQEALNFAEREYDLANGDFQRAMRAEAKCRLRSGSSQ